MGQLVSGWKDDPSGLQRESLVFVGQSSPVHSSRCAMGNRGPRCARWFVDRFGFSSCPLGQALLGVGGGGE